MLAMVLGRATLSLLEIHIDYKRKSVARKVHLGVKQDGPNAKGALAPLHSTAETDTSGDQEMAGPAASTSSSVYIGPRVSRFVKAHDPAAEYLESMDLQSFALQIAQKVATLDHIGVNLIGMGAQQRYWSVSRNSGEPRVSLPSIGDFWDGHRQCWPSSEEVGE